MTFSLIASSLVWAGILATSTSSAFVSRNPGFSAVTREAPKPLHMFVVGGDATTDFLTEAASSSALSHVSNFLVATIDSDIAKISDNEFAPIFAGGILVMFGGVLSALVVGGILESNDSYANVIADSYAQSEDDEEFWKGLSEEEATKTRELLKKIKDSKAGGDGSSSSPAPAVAEATAVLESQSSETSEATDAPKSETQKSGDMFSDY